MPLTTVPDSSTHPHICAYVFSGTFSTASLGVAHRRSQAAFLSPKSLQFQKSNLDHSSQSAFTKKQEFEVQGWCSRCHSLSPGLNGDLLPRTSHLRRRFLLRSGGNTRSDAFRPAVRAASLQIRAQSGSSTVGSDIAYSLMQCRPVLFARRVGDGSAPEQKCCTEK